ncbi:MAG: hypothetical protein AAF202_09135 [Pseudomonadota bacterium]
MADPESGIKFRIYMEDQGEPFFNPLLRRLYVMCPQGTLIEIKPPEVESGVATFCGYRTPQFEDSLAQDGARQFVLTFLRREEGSRECSQGQEISEVYPMAGLRVLCES